MSTSSWAGGNWGSGGFGGSAGFGGGFGNGNKPPAAGAPAQAKGSSQAAWGKAAGSQSAGNQGGWGTKAQPPPSMYPTQTQTTTQGKSFMGLNANGAKTPTSGFGGGTGFGTSGGFGGFGAKTNTGFGSNTAFGKPGAFGSGFGFGYGQQQAQQPEEVSVEISTHGLKFEYVEVKMPSDKTAWKMRHITHLPMYQSYTIEELRFNDYVKDGKLQPLRKPEGEEDHAKGGLFGKQEQQAKDGKSEKWDWWKALKETNKLPCKTAEEVKKDLEDKNPDRECYSFSKDRHETAKQTDSESKGAENKKIWHIKLKGFNRAKAQ